MAVCATRTRDFVRECIHGEHAGTGTRGGSPVNGDSYSAGVSEYDMAIDTKALRDKSSCRGPNYRVPIPRLRRN